MPSVRILNLALLCQNEILILCEELNVRRGMDVRPCYYCATPRDIFPLHILTGIFLLLQMAASTLMAHAIQAPLQASTSSRAPACSTSAPLILQKASFKVGTTPPSFISAACKPPSSCLHSMLYRH